MAKLIINLRSKYTFFSLSGLCFLYLIYHLTSMMASIDITGVDKVIFYIMVLFTALLFWVPFQFNELFI
jgi:hypothetical protein